MESTVLILFRQPQALSNALAALRVATAQGLQVSKSHRSLGLGV